MALSTNSVFEVRTAGNDTNGGGFVTGAAGTDYSQQDAKNTAGADISTTDAVAVGTTTITSVTANFGTTIVGNIIYFQGGTGAIAAQWRQVTARASTTSITIDAAIAASTGMTMNIGGALASPGMAGGVGLVTGNIVYIKAGTYTISSATPNISGGCLSVTTIAIFVLIGYQTTRGDLGTPPLLQASGISTFTIITVTGADTIIQNISVDGAGLTSSRGILARGLVYRCNGSNFTNSAFSLSTSVIFIRCVATGCSAVAAFTNGSCKACVAYSNTVTGFSLMTVGDALSHCISYSNSGASSDGFYTSSPGSSLIENCTAYGNGRDGIRVDNDSLSVQNCIAESNTGFGINSTNQDGCVLNYNATFGNTAGGINVGTGKGNLNIGSVVGSSSFFTNAAGADFSLNNTAGAGAAARAAGYPGIMPIGGTGFLDIGALQHGDPAGGGGGGQSVSIFGGP